MNILRTPAPRSPSVHRAGIARAVSLGCSLALAGLLIACGGGGGGGGGGGSGGTGQIAGTIMLPDSDFGIVSEREPNGTMITAQVLPPLQPRSVLVVAGEGGTIASHYGVVDTTDAFRLVCHKAQDVRLTLTQSTDGFTSANFDLAAVETGTGTLIQVSATAFNPEIVVFTLQADVVVDAVVTCASGAGAYRLEIETDDPVPAGTVLATAASTSPAVEAVDYLLDAPDVAPDHLLIRTEVGPAAAERMAALAGGRVVRRTGAGSYVVAFSSRFPDSGGREALAKAAALAGVRGVDGAEADPIVRPLATPTDSYFNRLWNMTAIGAPAAWDITFGSPSLVIGQIDTGIVAHPDLDAQRVAGYDFVSDASAGGDGNGRDPDPTDPGDQAFADGTSEWHGTHVAGIAVGRANDGYGICGVAPGCKLMPLRASGIGGGTASDLADAIRYAAGLDPTDDGPALASPLRVVNISLGSPVGSFELQNAVTAAAAAGVLIVASAGNNAGSVLFPAAYSDVLAVGAVDGRLVAAEYSNRGAPLDLMAPGGNDNRDVAGDGFTDGVLSCVLDETVSPRAPSHVYYIGTSMAAPHVTGAAALVLSVDPTLTTDEVRSILLTTCRDLDSPGTDTRTGAGLLQVGEAVRKTLLLLGTPRTDPPKLLLSTNSLRLVSSVSIATTYVINAGGGILHVGGVTSSTDSGQPWLSAFTLPALAGLATDTGEVDVVVDRTGLATGTYSGSVLVNDGVQVVASIRVVMEVGASPLSGIAFSVVARDAESGGVVASSVAVPENGYRYVFEGLAPGSYRIHAGTDLDRDGFFCETADWCGDYGGAVPAAVSVGAGKRVSGIDVTLTK